MVMEARHNHSMAKSQRDFVNKNVSKLEGEKGAWNHEQKEAQDKNAQSLAKIEAIKQMIADDEKKVEAVRKKIVAHNVTTSDKEAQYADQKAALEADKLGGLVSGTMLGIKIQALWERRQELREIENKGMSMTHNMERLQQIVSLSREKVDSMETKLNEDDGLDIIQVELDLTQAQLTEAQALFSAAEADVTDKAATKGLAEEALNKWRDLGAEANRRLPAIEQKLETKRDTKRELTKRLLDARDVARSSTAKLNKDRMRLNETDQEYNATDAEAEARDRRLSEQAESLAKSREGFQNVRWAHERKKPLIVSHHNLVSPLQL